MVPYGEVMQSNPEYAKYLIKENKRDNQKARFTHWVMAFMAEALWGEDKREKEEIEEEGSQTRETGCRGRYRRMTDVERAHAKKEDQDPDMDSDGIPESEMEDLVDLEIRY